MGEHLIGALLPPRDARSEGTLMSFDGVWNTGGNSPTGRAAAVAAQVRDPVLNGRLASEMPVDPELLRHDADGGAVVHHAFFRVFVERGAPLGLDAPQLARGRADRVVDERSSLTRL